MQRAIIVNSLDDFKAFRVACSGDWHEFKVYTLRPTTCLEFRMAGIPAYTLSENITPEEAEHLYQRAAADAARVVEASSSAQGAGIVRLARLFKVYYWEFLVDAYALDNVLSKWNLKSDIWLHYVRRHSPPPSAHANLVEPGPMAEHMFRAAHLSGQVKPVSVSPLFLTNTSRRMRGWMGQMQGDARRAILTAMRRGSVKVPDFPAGKRAIGWGSGYDALTVIPDVIQEAGLKPLWVTDGINASTNRTGLVYNASYDSIERFSISQYLAGQPSSSLTSDERTLVAKAYSTLLTAVDATDVGGRYRLSWLLRDLRPEFTTGLLVARRMDSILGQWAGSTLALTHFNGLHERIIEQLAPRYNIQVSARQHGWIANPEGYEFEAAQYIVPGRLQAQFVRHFFGYGEQVVAKPDLNLVRVADEWRGKSQEEQRAIAAEKRLSLHIKARHVIVVLATMARNRILNELDYPLFENCWLGILDYLKNHPELQVVVKAHPTFNYNRWLSALAAQQGVKNISILAGRLEEVLGWADLVVDLGYPGTAVIVTLLFGKPLLLYRGLYKYVRAFSDITHHVGRDFLVDTPAALLAEWDRFIREGDVYLRSLQARNQVLLEGLTQTL